MENQDILVVKNLKKYYPVRKFELGREKSFVKAVDDVSFTIRRGTTMGLVGESGCGKTTVGRTILRLHDVTAGQVLFDGQNLAKLSTRTLRKLRPQMQMIFQDPYSSLSPRMPVGEIIGEAVREHKIVPKSQYKSYIARVMRDCGLQPQYFHRYPHEFSGGQRQRICIARAVALNPRFIICDEPVSALDVSIQAQIINLMMDLQDQFGYTYLFISHDLSVVEHISDTIGVMYLGNIVEMGDKKSVFANPMHPYTRSLLSAVPVSDPDVKMNRIILSGEMPSPVNPPSGCKFRTRCPNVMKICAEKAPVFKEYEAGHSVACHLYPQDENETVNEPHENGQEK
ncbi:MAG: ABC transporter ATP-binding protein [Saccharofermentanales bacterium]|jgi:peptide/nickel transport system ATP-binding protein|nr:dipeptide ABC transporter ATP-binding protein [Clostridiaceae bacterium]